MDDKRYPGFTAVLPPRVRYDKELRPQAKLLYAEITAMADVTGFCWATNRYLAALYGLSKNTVSELLAQLEDKGYIVSQVLRDEKNAVTERRLFITDAGLLRLPPITKNRDRGIPKNPDSPIPKNREENDTREERTPPYSPPRGTRRRNEHKDAPDWMPEDFARLWLWYPTGDKAMHPKRGNRQKAIRAWDKLHPSEELIDVIAHALGRQAKSEEWREGVGIPHLSTYLNNAGWEGWTDGDL